jgi:cardiolipin synthase
MKWNLLAEIVYGVILLTVCLRIIYDIRSSSKTLAYLLLAVFVPVAGMVFYFLFGKNYRKYLIYSKKLITDDKRLRDLNERIISTTEESLQITEDEISEEGKGLVNLLLHDNLSPLTTGNTVTLLINGEEKFPDVFRALDSAKRHIHLEYFIYENDIIGNMIKDILIRKVSEGVKVRIIYDDFGSRSIRKRLVKELRQGGVEAYPFNKVRLLLFANRINYRNHRKIIIVDGKTGFTGGINISDLYINNQNKKNKYFWRDTHLRIDGPGTLYLQNIFLCDWNFCSGQKLEPDASFFDAVPQPGSNVSVQIAASGPDSPNSTIMLSLLKAISIAKEEILITTPYFIPGGSIIDGLKMASLGGVSVKLLVPGISDSLIVNAAARSYYGELLNSGAEIYLYRKGFVHSKTVVIDKSFSVVGTANMNHRSFNLDFEVNANIFSGVFAKKMRIMFYNDLNDAEKINYDTWKMRPGYVKLPERIARLFSPFL